MMWHTAIDSQRLALRGEPVLPSHGRPAQLASSRQELGNGRGSRGIRRE
jgi:hypothetical protein